jgi:hypothetical protein
MLGARCEASRKLRSADEEILAGERCRAKRSGRRLAGRSHMGQTDRLEGVLLSISAFSGLSEFCFRDLHKWTEGVALLCTNDPNN